MTQTKLVASEFVVFAANQLRVRLANLCLFRESIHHFKNQKECPKGSVFM